MSQQLAEDKRAGLEAVGRNSFSEAYPLLRRAYEADELSGEELERFSDSAFWSGHPDDSLEAREKAFAIYQRAGEPLKAGLVALTLSRDYGERNDSVLAGSWFSRAEKLLGSATESREFGYLEMMRSYMAHYSGRPDAAVEHARRAEALGAKHGDRDLQGLSLMPQAMALIHDGQLEEGMKLMDEATVAAVSGELTPEVTGAIYCNTIGICRELADFKRAAQWTEAAERWCKRTSISGFPGICRVHRAEIMSLRGSWLEAEREAVKAVDELARYGSAEIMSQSFSEIGMIRLRMGDLEGAQDAFEHAHEIYKAPQPGLALLRLAQGKPEAALESVKLALAEETWNRLTRAKMLPALVEVAQALGDTQTAEDAQQELAETAKQFGSTALLAESATATAIVATMKGDHAKALTSAREARRLWQEVGAPYEAARTRVLIGAAMVAKGELETGHAELRAARSNLEKIGALVDARKVGELLEDQNKHGPPKTTVRTFMFTDIVKSTDLVQILGDDAWSDLLRWHDQALRDLFKEHRGEEIKQVGDGFFVAFEDPASAVACAIAIQRNLIAHRREHGFAPQVRIGLHAATALDFDGDYGGSGVHEAARIGAISTGGEIVVSKSTIEGLDLAVKGERAVELKGISHPVEVVSLSW